MKITKNNIRVLTLLILSTLVLSCVTNAQLKPPASQNQITVVVEFLSIEGYFYESAIPAEEVERVVAEEVCENKAFYDFEIIASTQGLAKFSAGCTIGEGEGFKKLTFSRQSANQYRISEIQGFTL